MDSFGLMVKQPLVIMPFVIIAFLECLALEAVYFSTRNPISVIANPIIRKFFGEQFLHYPAYLVLLPKLFYYSQLLIYIFAGALLTAIAVNIFKNIREGLPVRADAMIKNASKSYISFFGYAIIIVIVVLLLKKFDIFAFTKFVKVLSKIGIHASTQIYYAGLTLVIFLSNIILQAFVLLTIPVMVIGRKRLIPALLQSISLGFRNFGTIATLIFLPFFVYLPITFLKSFSAELAEKTFPEINLYMTLLGIIVVVFLDCFIIICASRFLMDRYKAS
jgi:hypothetical protein